MIFLISLVFLTSCGSRVERLSSPLLTLSKQEPALSGSGQFLALIVDQNGRPTVQLRNLRSGKILPLRSLSRNQPHSSPSLSWNGRYLAVITQRFNRRQAIIKDRLTGRTFQLPIPGERVPIRLSLASDASQLAMQFSHKGKWKIEIFDISKNIEPDLPSGMRVSTPVQELNR